MADRSMELRASQFSNVELPIDVHPDMSIVSNDEQPLNATAARFFSVPVVPTFLRDVHLSNALLSMLAQFGISIDSSLDTPANACISMVVHAGNSNIVGIELPPA
jgi:hypothetical protein